MAKKNWIQDAIKKPGALRKTAKVKVGQNIPKKKLASLAKKPGVTGQRARLAETLSKMHKGMPKKKPTMMAKAYAKRVMG